MSQLTSQIDQSHEMRNRSLDQDPRFWSIQNVETEAVIWKFCSTFFARHYEDFYRLIFDGEKTRSNFSFYTILDKVDQVTNSMYLVQKQSSVKKQTQTFSYQELPIYLSNSVENASSAILKLHKKCDFFIMGSAVPFL